MLMLWSSPTTKSGQAPYGFLPVVRSGQQSKYLVAVQGVANIVKLGLHQCVGSADSKRAKLEKQANVRSVGRGMPCLAKMRFAEPEHLFEHSIKPLSKLYAGATDL